MLDQLVALARYDALLLAIAAGRTNERATTLAAARLRWSLQSALQVSERAQSDVAAGHRLTLGALVRRWKRVQETYSLSCDPIEATLGGLGRSKRSGIDAIGSKLVELDLARMDLTEIDLTMSSLRDLDLTHATLARADLSHARIEDTSLCSAIAVSASIERATFDDCDLACSNLGATSWCGAVATWCNFEDASLTDAWLAMASFSDCCFRGADFGMLAGIHAAGLAGARFVRCDLRYTNWRGRDLSGASFVDCSFHGAYGAPSVADATIERPNLSRGITGPQIGTREDVATGWATVIGWPRA